ncbi:MAG: hypothetical protein ACMUHY_05780 [Thermoplasmatota archaeon]
MRFPVRWSFLRKKGYLGLALTILLSLAVLFSVGFQTIASPGSRGISANCNSCHVPSIYLTVDIQTVESPLQVRKNAEATVNVTVLVSGSHRSYTYTGFGIDVWLQSSTERTDTGGHQILSGRSLSGSSAPYTWQQTFTFTVTGKESGSDAINVKARMSPRHESPPVTDSEPFNLEIINSPPTLAHGSVDPLEGGDDGTYSYSVNYTDPDGDAPSYIRVIVDGERKFDLTDLPGGDGSYQNGEDFGIGGIVLSEGDHFFSFESSDGTAPIVHPAGAPLIGPTVTHTNSPPRLESSGVTPLAGAPGDDFTFRVIYYDVEDQPPSGGVMLSMDGGSRLEEMEPDTNSSPELRDGDNTNGEAFVLVMDLQEGEHSFSFNASDGIDHTQIGPFTGPVVSIEPVLGVTITSPRQGQKYFDNETLIFRCEIDSNVDIIDTNYSWTSNISGSIGFGDELTADLPEGEHLITLIVTSDEYDLSASDSVNVTIVVWVEPREVPLILGSSPSVNVTMIEMETARFSVSLDPLHPHISGGGEVRIGWYLDRNLTLEDGESFDYTPGLEDSGQHGICVRITAGPSFAEHCWNVTVNDRKTSIQINGSIMDDLGEMSKGDVLMVSLPLADEFGRDLEVEWSVDGSPVEGRGLELRLELRRGIWAHEGSHLLVARVTNPDGTLMIVEMSYSILPVEVPDNDGDDNTAVEDEGRRGQRRLFEDPAEAAIILIGAFGILGGVIYAGYALMAPLDRRKREVHEE